MFSRTRQTVFLVLFLTSCLRAWAQLGGVGTRPASTSSMLGIEQNQMGLWMNESDDDKRRSMLENFSDSVSQFDLKAPGAARREYEKGTQFLLKKSFSDAVEHFARAIATYPNFVAAHNALGSAYLDLGRNEEAQNEFLQSVTLDGHLPHSYMNLGRAQWALKNFSGAQASMQKASELAPLDLRLLSALTYAQLLNRDYGSAIATAQRVHGLKHEKNSIVHYFAAASWQGQNNLQEAQKELQTLLNEDPKSPVAETARQMIEQIKKRKDQPTESVTITYSTTPDDPNVASDARARKILQQFELQRQVAEVEKEPEEECGTCGVVVPASLLTADVPASCPLSRVQRGSFGGSGLILHTTVNEVAVFFAATDHGKSVSDLTRESVVIRDDGKPPVAVTGFRNEAQLPLRLGLVIDTSSSITRQFAFEQKAAASFLQKTLTDKHDLAFVVGFSSTVLMVQDFTGDDAAISNSINQLAPRGGTALWDAVKFASDKLAAHRETQPVARILVVISDGDDNCSEATLKQAIETAVRNEVIVYTVSTREFRDAVSIDAVADQAMRVLASRSGGAAFFPDSLGDLQHGLAELQQVIRSRYLISYKPDHFEANGHYRSIDVVAQKSGHKLHVYSRRGYYANAKPGS
jgi:Ca-activated chloride channel family protein